MHFPALIVHFDGGCQPANPGGTCTFGWHIDLPDGTPIHEEAGVCTDRPSHERTNNLAEWEGLCDALQWLDDEGHTVDRLTIKGDSQLVLNQLRGRWKTKASHLKGLLGEARKRIRAITGGARVQAVWIPREQNSRADALAGYAYQVEQCQKSR